MSGCILLLANSHSPVFLVNSCLDLFSAPQSPEDPLSRSYGANLPSSLTVNLPSASVYSTRPRVSVYGTGAAHVNKLSGFSREHDYLRCRAARRPCVLSGFSSERGFACAPQHLCHSTRYSVSARECHSSVTAIAVCGSNGILTVSAIGLAVRLILRTRLTPGRLALPGKPWSFGGRASNPPYRYLYLHLLFRKLQRRSPCTFGTDGMLPYR